MCEKDTHKFTLGGRVDGRKSLLNLIAVQDEYKNNIFDVNVLRGAGGGISDHHVVVAKIRCLGRCLGRVIRMEERNERKVSELIKVMCKTEYEEELKKRWDRVWGK